MFARRLATYLVVIGVCMAIGLANSAYAAERLFSLGFEEAGWEDFFRSGAWEGRVARTNSNPHSGEYSLRGNLLQDLIDPIIGLPGEGNMQLEFVGNNFTSYTDNEIFIRFWMRFDESTWVPEEAGKTFYLTDDVVGTKAFYLYAGMNSSSASLSDNGAYYDFCVENWGYQKAYLGNSENIPVGSDGLWHNIALYVNYDQNYIVFWIDGRQLVGEGPRGINYPDGQLAIPEDFHLRGLQMLYVADYQVVESLDGSEYACGFQFDDFEIWDTIPPDVEAPIAPPSPGIPGTPGLVN